MVPSWRVAVLLVGMLAFVPLEPFSGLERAGAQAAPGHLIVEDPAGDQGPFSLGIINNPEPATFGHADIVRVEVGYETEDQYEVRITMVGSSDVATPARALAVRDLRCELEFHFGSVGDDEGYWYTVDFFDDLLDMPHLSPNVADYYAGLYAYTEDRSDWVDIREGVSVTYDDPSSTYSITLQKPFTPVFPGARAPGMGDHLEFREVMCRTDTLLYGNWRDTVELDDQRYEFQAPTSSGLISLSFDAETAATGVTANAWQPPSADGPAMTTIEAGKTTILPLHIKNNAPSRKLVELQATFAEESQGTPWNTTLVPNIFLAGGENRTLNLVVAPPADAQPGMTQTLRVTAKTTGEEHVSVARQLLQVTPVLGPLHNTLFLHTWVDPPSSPSDEALALVLPDFELGVSLLRQDPAWPDAEARISPIFTASGRAYLDPLPRPVVLDPEVPVEIVLAFTGPPESEVDVRVVLQADDGGEVFEVRKTLPGNGVHTLTAFINEEATALDAGEELAVTVRFIRSDRDADMASELTFDPRQSMIVLPVRTVRQADVTLGDGRFVPSLRLAPGEDSDAYLNPNKQYAFEFHLANDGIETDDLRVSVNATNATGWDVAIVPGAAFRVSPGNYTPLGVVVRAPEGTQEGHVAEFEVLAKSTHDPVARARLILTAIVTTGVEIDEKPYGTRHGQLEPLQDTADAPGPAWALTSLVLLGLVPVRRRLDRS